MTRLGPSEPQALTRGEGALRGRRLWVVEVLPGGDAVGEPVLASTAVGGAWAGRTIHAACPRGGAAIEGHGPVPSPACTCGIYAVRHDEDLPFPGALGMWALGAVDLWGRVIEAERGFRGEWGEIVDPLGLRLACSRGWRARWSAACGPVVGAAVGSRIEPFCARHARRGEDAVEVAFLLDRVAARLELRYGVTVVPPRGR